MGAWRGWFAALIGLMAACAAAQPLTVGSKRFTESYVLGEIVTLTAVKAGAAEARHKPGLGNTALVHAALRSGDILVYPEYTGTIALELLGLSAVPPLEALNVRLHPLGLTAGVPLGFANGYALAMPARRAAELGITRISQLTGHPGLRYALSQEFLQRADGWPGLARTYGLGGGAVRPTGLDHGLAYEAVRRGQADVIDVYTTDPKIARDGLVVLEDDRRHFPAYDALLLYRSDLPSRYPAAWAAIARLENTLSVDRMRALNAAVELEDVAYRVAAAAFVEGVMPESRQATGVRGLVMTTFGGDFWALTAQHLVLVLASLAASVAVGVPLGWFAHRVPRARYPILAAAGLLQTIPSLALLALLIAALDRIGSAPALIALALYALLPVVRNTVTGLDGVAGELRQAASALGLTGGQRFRHIELPLAAPAVLAGIRTAAVLNVGTATIAAFVGAGGYGERIVAGLAVHDTRLLLAGAIPAALLALVIEAIFHLAERRGRFRRAADSTGR